MRSGRLTRRLFQLAYRFLSGYDHPVTLTARDPAELQRLLDWIDDDVPPRPRRTREHQDHQEWYCARRFLLALADAGRLEYPLTLRKGQSPDFMIAWPDGTETGLEVTEATTAAFQRGLTETGAAPGPHILGPADGWCGDEVERELADAIVTQVEKKLVRIARPHWRQAHRHDLLIYSNGGWINPDLGHLAGLVRAALAGLGHATGPWPNGPPGQVALLHGSAVVADLGGASVVLSPLRPAGAVPIRDQSVRNLAEGAP